VKPELRQLSLRKRDRGEEEGERKEDELPGDLAWA
jgi:hypothetical protein